MGGSTLLPQAVLAFNSLITSAVVIVAFSLLAYIALQNLNSPIARALCVLLAGVVIVFGGDVLLAEAQRDSTILFLLRAQWFGIVCVPAGYLHLADTLLTYSGFPSKRRQLIVPVGYTLSAVFLVLAFGSVLLVRDGITSGPMAQFAAGPLFWLFELYFVLASIVGLVAVAQVRHSALTATLRRRLTYLGLTFLAPALAVFPYLAAASALTYFSPLVILFVSAIVNGTVAVMLIIMVYSIAFQGMLLPDRLIKQDFVRWGLYGPFIGVVIILFLRIVPVLAHWIALPAETLLTFGVMVMTVFMPVFVSKIKPYLDTLIYAQDRAEIDYLRALPRATFTYADLRSLLENTLVVVCGTLHVNTGFVAAQDTDDTFTIKSYIGPRRDIRQFLSEHPLIDLVAQARAAPPREQGVLPPPEAFVRCNGFSLLALRDPEGRFLGALGVANPSSGLTAESRRLIGVMAHQMELALATVDMQQRLFDTLRGMAPEMESLQKLNSRLEQATPGSLETLETEVALLPEFPQLVKDALGSYWGGIKLSDSPLLGLRTVRRVIGEQGGSPTRALQAVLRRAIENLRPDQQLDPSAQEWLMYNILEMRFLQGKRVRDTAERLAMSESDLYRKQRAAIEEVARQLALMEETELR